MKTLALISVVVLAAGCGGSWSNKDLEFLNAMPTREQLTTKVPVAASSGLTGVGTRKDGLGLGEPSQAYKDTAGASAAFNGLLEFMIHIIEVVRAAPPTSRTLDTRTWGPFQDDRPGLEDEVVITRVDPTLFTFEIRQRNTGGQFFAVVHGRFKPTADLEHGAGEITIDPGGTRAAQIAVVGFDNIDLIEMGYQTENYPVTITMKITSTPNGGVDPGLAYTYQETAKKAGQFTFDVRGTDPKVTAYLSTSQFVATGEGRTTFTVTEGDYTGANATECWDATFKTTYATQNWPGGVTIGDAGTCISVPDLSP